MLKTPGIPMRCSSCQEEGPAHSFLERLQLEPTRDAGISREIEKCGGWAVRALWENHSLWNQRNLGLFIFTEV